MALNCQLNKMQIHLSHLWDFDTTNAGCGRQPAAGRGGVGRPSVPRSQQHAFRKSTRFCLCGTASVSASPSPHLCSQLPPWSTLPSSPASASSSSCLTPDTSRSGCSPLLPFPWKLAISCPGSHPCRLPDASLTSSPTAFQLVSTAAIVLPLTFLRPARHTPTTGPLHQLVPSALSRYLQAYAFISSTLPP